MKRTLLLVAGISLFGCLVALIALWALGTNGNDSFSPEKWEAGSLDQRRALIDTALQQGRLPVGQETKILGWLFTEDPQKAARTLRPFQRSVANLPRHLSDTAWELFLNGSTDSGVAALRLARDLYPNDPDVLGISGVIAYRSGEREAARTLLNEAVSWGLDRPVVTFYLGGLLVQSDSAADRLRGKQLLLKVLESATADYAERAGLALLTNRTVALIPEEIRTVYETLAERNVFTGDNPNLPAPALRLLANRLAPTLPEAALQMAELLLESPDSTQEDHLGFIRLAQDMGEMAKAREWMDKLPEDALQSPAGHLLTIVQQFLEEKYSTALQGLRKQVNSNPAQEGLRDAFRSILQRDLPVGTESDILELYLLLPELPYLSALYAVDRLLAISPLQTEEWVQYAIEQLLPRKTLSTGEWLLLKDQAEPLIRELEERGELSRDETLALLKAYLQEEQAPQAEQLLQESRSRFDTTIASFFEARVYHQLDQPERAFNAWMDAERGATASDRFPLLKQLGFLALEMGRSINALQTLQTAFSAGMDFSEREAARLLQLSLDYGTLAQTIPIAAYLAEKFPQNPVHINNLAYFHFLDERNLEEGIASMEKLVEEYPERQAYRLTLALGLLKAGSFNKANRLIESGQIDWNEVGERGQLIYAAVLAANDQRVVAQGLLQNIDPENLIPEERALMPSF